MQEGILWRRRGIFLSLIHICLIFNGEDTQKPVISEMILACRVPVNVLFADTKSVEMCIRDSFHAFLLLSKIADKNQQKYDSML